MKILDPHQPVAAQCPKFIARCRGYLNDLGNPKGYTIDTIVEDDGLFRPALVHCVVGDADLGEPEGLDVNEPFDAPTTSLRLGNAQLVADNMAADIARALDLAPMSTFE